VLPIGRFSRRFRISTKSLRHYDELGLLKPAKVDDASGYRYYSVQQADVAERIWVLRRGFRSLFRGSMSPVGMAFVPVSERD
jgi:DNA-binding transcriptional MerR regulator